MLPLADRSDLETIEERCQGVEHLVYLCMRCMTLGDTRGLYQASCLDDPLYQRIACFAQAIPQIRQIVGRTELRKQFVQTNRLTSCCLHQRRHVREVPEDCSLGHPRFRCQLGRGETTTVTSEQSGSGVDQLGTPGRRAESPPYRLATRRRLVQVTGTVGPSVLCGPTAGCALRSPFLLGGNHAGSLGEDPSNERAEDPHMIVV